MTPSRLLLPGALLCLVLTGCSTDGDSAPTPDPAPATPSGPSSVAPPTSSEPSVEPVSITFGSSGEATIGCTRFVRYVEFDTFSVDAPVELTELTAELTGGVRLGRAWISDDPEQALSSGSYATGAKGSQVTDEPGWDTKVPLEGYRVVPGTDYTLFTQVFIPRTPGALTDLTLGYRDADGTEGTAPWPITVTRAARCD